MKTDLFFRAVNESKIGALLLAAIGCGLLCALPETVVAGRYVFAALLLMAAFRYRKFFRHQTWHFGLPAAAGILDIVLLCFSVETGFLLALSGGFLLIFLSAFQPMLRVHDNWERAGIGAAGIAALLFAIVIWSLLFRLDLIECRSVFAVAAFAGALTLCLRPAKRGKK